MMNMPYLHPYLTEGLNKKNMAHLFYITITLGALFFSGCMSETVLTATLDKWEIIVKLDQPGTISSEMVGTDPRASIELESGKLIEVRSNIVLLDGNIKAVFPRGTEVIEISYKKQEVEVWADGMEYPIRDDVVEAASEQSSSDKEH